MKGRVSPRKIDLVKEVYLPTIEQLLWVQTAIQDTEEPVEIQKEDFDRGLQSQPRLQSEMAVAGQLSESPIPDHYSEESASERKKITVLDLSSTSS